MLGLGKLKSLVGAAAPLLGKAVGLGGAVDILASAFGTNEDPEEVAKAIENDPEAFVKLKQIELEHEAELAKLSLAETSAFLQDKQNARSREAAIYAKTGKRDFFMTSVGVGIVVGFFLFGALILFVEMPEESKATISIFFGVLGAKFSSIVDYLFGSSKGSADKTEMLRK